MWTEIAYLVVHGAAGATLVNVSGTSISRNKSSGLLSLLKKSSYIKTDLSIDDSKW